MNGLTLGVARCEARRRGARRRHRCGTGDVAGNRPCHCSFAHCRPVCVLMRAGSPKTHKSGAACRRVPAIEPLYLFASGHRSSRAHVRARARVAPAPSPSVIGAPCLQLWVPTRVFGALFAALQAGSSRRRCARVATPSTWSTPSKRAYRCCSARTSHTQVSTRPSAPLLILRYTSERPPT